MGLKKRETVASAACLALLVSAGVVNGLQTDRWGPDQRLEKAAEQVEEIPRLFGEWSGVPVDIPARQLEGAGAISHFAHDFRRSGQGPVIRAIILCGRRGQMAVHQPTMCFTGGGWRTANTPDVETLVPSRGEGFWVAGFTRKVDGLPEHQLTCWAWNDGSRWKAPTNPRFEYAGKPFLYKMYLSAGHVGDDTELLARKAIQDFLQDFLPVVDQKLLVAKSD